MAELTGRYGGYHADFLKPHIKSQAKYVQFGYGQVEPNHLSAQRTAQVYAQLPANKDIKILEQGQFVKYDYAANENGIGEVNFKGAGEWMLVYNEIKLYRDEQWDCEFALRADDFHARFYTPYDWENTENEKLYRAKWLNGVDAEGKDGIELNGVKYKYDDVTADTPDYYEKDWTNDPFLKMNPKYYEKRMGANTSSMVPRVFKTNVGDIFTTNTINEETLAIGDLLTPQAADGILAKAGAEEAAMKWQVVKLYTMPDGQKGVKVMRIA